MRGPRRRNKALLLDEQRAASDPDSGAVGGGAVKLVETRSPAEAEPDDGPPTDPTTPPPMYETISDVATAHAHLDSVLSPEAPDSGSEVTDEHIMNVDDPSAAAPEPLSNVESPASGESQSSVVEVDPSPPMEDISPPVEETAGEILGRAQGAEVVEEPATGTKSDSTPEGQSAAGNPLPRVMAVANQKGGVGKTTTSVNLGAALAELGFRVLVIDLDPQGNATTGLGIDARNFELSMYDVLMRDASLEDCVEPTSMKNLFVAPATIALAGAEIELVPAFSRELKLKRSIESVIDDFDYVLIDCPPSLGPHHGQRPGRGRRGAGAHPVRVLRPGGSEPADAQRPPGGVEPQPEAGYLHHRADHVRRPDQVGRSGGRRGARALRRQGLSDRDPPDRPALGGSVVRTADHRLRPRLPRGHRLSGTSQGGQRWHVVAGWARV